MSLILPITTNKEKFNVKEGALGEFHDYHPTQQAHARTLRQAQDDMPFNPVSNETG